MFMFAYGAQIAYMVIIGDTIPTVIKHSQHDAVDISREMIMTLFASLIILPLCLLKHLSSLSRTSSLSVVSDLILVLIIVSNSFNEGAREGIDTDIEGSSIISPNIFAGIGTISFAFVCQHNSFLVFKSLKNPTIENWRYVAHISVGISLGLSLLLGILGYLSFKEATKGDILTNFPESNQSINIARVLLAICMTFVYPMECYVSRHCICSLIDKLMDREAGNMSTFSILSQGAPNSSSSANSMSSNSSSTEPLATFHKRSEDNLLVRSSISIILWASSLLIAIVCGDLGSVLALTGALAASMLGFVIPGILYIKTHESEFMPVCSGDDIDDHSFQTYPTFWQKFKTIVSVKNYHAPIFMIIFGFSVLLLGCLTVIQGKG